MPVQKCREAMRAKYAGKVSIFSEFRPAIKRLSKKPDIKVIKPLAIRQAGSNPNCEQVKVNSIQKIGPGVFIVQMKQGGTWQNFRIEINSEIPLFM